MVDRHYSHLKQTWLHEQVNKFLPPIYPMEGSKTKAPVTVPSGVSGQKRGTKVYDATGESTTTWTVEADASGEDLS